MHVDELELIERCRSGDDTAFAELVDRYKDLVYGLIYRMVPDRRPWTTWRRTYS